MNADAALLEPVLANPDDDHVRLVLADALIELGDPRGELIAVQCAVASKPNQKLRAREQELLQTHREKWFGPLERFLRERGAHEYVVRRGFVDHVRVQLQGRPGEVDDLFAVAPTLRSLEVNGDGLTVSQGLKRLNRLCVTGTIGELADLLIIGYFDGLNALDLQVIEGDPGEGLVRLTELLEFRTTWAARDLWPLPKRLRVLDGYGEDLIRTQLTEPRKMLREVALRSATIDFDGADLLAQQAPFLGSLLLRMSTVSPEVLRRLFRVEWRQLQRLELQGVRLDSDAVQALLTLIAPQLSNVELNIVHLGDAGAREVFKSPWFSQLKRLSLVGNRLTDDALAPLLEWPASKKVSLEELALGRNQISPGALAQLKRLRSFRGTEFLC